ncbi:MAG: hypothetical protein EOP05_15365, partial [Proteobacteria bacterium]
MQYRFTDGTCITGHQILYHPYSKDVPRHLLPLNVNVKADLQDRSGQLVDAAPIASGFRPQWQVQAERVLLSILLAAVRARKQKQTGDDDGRGPDDIYLTFSDHVTENRPAFKLETIELWPEAWGPWRVNTALPATASGVYYGRARVELDPTRIPDIRSLSRSFFVDPERKALNFHAWEEQLSRLSIHAPKRPPAPTAAAPVRQRQTLQSIVAEGRATLLAEAKARGETLEPTESELAEAASETAGETDAPSTDDAEASDAPPTAAVVAEAAVPAGPHPSEVKDDAPGISLHVTGHAAIQATISDITDMFEKDGARLPIYPESLVVPADKVHTKISLTSDGSFKFLNVIETPTGKLEAHGLPQGSAYLLANLQVGLGGTTGYSVSQLATPRKGAKRERDLKVLRHLGFSTLIFFEAASFALGEPLSDGTKVETKEDLLNSIYTRLGSLILKSEGWPTQEGTLPELCSANVTTLIEGFVKQVIADLATGDDAR